MTMSPGDPAKTLTQLVATEIRVEMARQGIRQSQLARRLDTNDTWLSVRLRGVQPIDLNDLARIATALEVPINKLLPTEAVTHTLRNRRSAESTSSEPVSPDRPPREPKRQRTRPAGTTPKTSTRRPGMLPRPSFA